MGIPVVFTKNKFTNHNKLKNACELVDKIFNGNEKVSEKVLTKYLSDKPQLTKNIITNSPVFIKTISVINIF